MVARVAKERDTTGFGGRLRALRLARGLSQEALAEKCGKPMRYQHVAKLERGESVPKWPTVVKLAKALGVDPGEFLPPDEQSTSGESQV